MHSHIILGLQPPTYPIINLIAKYENSADIFHEVRVLGYTHMRIGIGTEVTLIRFLPPHIIASNAVIQANPAMYIVAGLTE